MNIRQFLIVLVGLWFLSSLAGAITQQPNQDVFVLTLKYDRGNIYMQSLILTKSFFYPPVNQPREGYNLSLVAFDGITLYSQNFNFPLEVHTAPDPNWFDERGNQIYFPGRNETTIIKESANVELILPYYENAQRIVIKDKNNIEVFSYIVNQNSHSETFISNEAVSKEEVNDSKGNLEDIKKAFYWLLGSLTVLVIIILIILKIKSRLSTK